MLAATQYGRNWLSRNVNQCGKLVAPALLGGGNLGNGTEDF
jgi:hypothetical protein